MTRVSAELALSEGNDGHARAEQIRMIDIFTLERIVTATEEHILPRCLGGRLAKVGLIDKTTNDETGHMIDAKLDEALRSIRVITGAMSSDGKPPRSLTSVMGDDGKPYTVAVGGVMRQAPQISTRKLDSGETLIQGSVPDEAALRDMLRKHARRSGKKLDHLVQDFTSSSKKRVEAAPALPFSCEVWDTGARRATAKIACNLLAFAAPDLFLDAAFNGVREYVLKGTELAVHPVQAVDARASEGMGPLDHLVRVDLQSSGVVSALVVYFGHLAFVVQLGVLAPREPLSVAYRVDQLGGTDRLNATVDLDVPVPSFADAAASPDDDVAKLAGAQLERLLPVALEIQRRLWFDRIFREEEQRFFAEIGERELTESEARTFIGTLAARFVEELTPSAQRASQRRHDAASAELAAAAVAAAAKKRS